jgi:hypothetical protein
MRYITIYPEGVLPSSSTLISATECHCQGHQVYKQFISRFPYPILYCLTINNNRLLVKHGARSTEHTEYGAVEKRKSLYNKIHCLLLQIFVIINKVFSRFTRRGSKKIGLLKNTYAKLPKAIVVFRIGL